MSTINGASISYMFTLRFRDHYGRVGGKIVRSGRIILEECLLNIQ